MANERIPKRALSFTVGDFELGDNGEDAKSAPFRMVARSGQPIEHWFWGNVVHDLAGMRMSKQRIPIDYAHDEKEVIGYANRFDSESGDLVLNGALVPFKDSDRATEIIHKQKAGVPYEASINFGGDGIKVEKVHAGASVEVNGYTLSGPATVIREWPLRGVAICPYGADANTSTEFSEGDTVAVDITETEAMPEESKVQDEIKEENQPVAEAVEETPVEAVDEAAVDTVEAAVEETAAVEAEPVVALSEGQRFLEAFGDKGGVWFAQGKTFSQAMELFVDGLKSENAELRQKLSASAGMGEESPVEFSTADKPQKTPAIRIAHR